MISDAPARTSSSAMAERRRDAWRDFKGVGHFEAKY